MKLIPVCVLTLASVVCAFGQKDFLTSDEVEKVREAQEPNERLKLYVLFARQRMDQLQQLLAKDKKGRSIMARELLTDYVNILEAIDTVSDDALKRHATLTEGTTAVGAAEKRFLGQLQKISDSAPADLGLYDIELKEALAATSDSMELAQGDLGKRGLQLAADEKKEKKAVEGMIAAEDAKGDPVKTAALEAKAADAATDKPKRKPPTLYRPGEKPPDPAP